MIDLGLNRHAPPVYVHVGDCWNASKGSRTVSRGRPGAPSPTGSRRARSASPIWPWGCWT
ncbi:DUF6233 domain-containing protein [Streptomyces sp. 4N124]|uniref:DUF6233 domain-containing protein n=1 Tax=Streptomyces sp. 4N124 TaxID=3457420 RepID=UPI003FD3678F